MRVLLKSKKDIENIILTEIKEMREQGVFVGTTGILSEERFRNAQLNIIKDFKDNEVMEVEKRIWADGTGYHYVFPWFVEDGKQYYGNIQPEWVEKELN